MKAFKAIGLHQILNPTSEGQPVLWKSVHGVYVCVVRCAEHAVGRRRYLTVINTDVTVYRYRVTVYNMWLPWCRWSLFDSYLSTIKCFRYNAQFFRKLSASCATIDPRDQSPPTPHNMGSCLTYS
ncbi:odorant receptor 2a-like [Aphis craccivora]|uniref:Odorant receptor 2a-like n=1 Tax=Aphis craccivora TaxID=307492 RepID=A0A6G0YYF0_APHCR|nr:odorant receptor 2a-like [Aphis craccivora]